MINLKLTHLSLSNHVLIYIKIKKLLLDISFYRPNLSLVTICSQRFQFFLLLNDFIFACVVGLRDFYCYAYDFSVDRWNNIDLRKVI